MLLLICLFLIISEAVYEALYDEGKKTISGLIEFFYKAVVTVMALLWLSGQYNLHLPVIPFWKVLLGFLFLRFALFDAVYNLMRRLPLFYVGSSKVYDKLWGWFFRLTKFPKEHFLAMLKFIFLLIGISYVV